MQNLADLLQTPTLPNEVQVPRLTPLPIIVEHMNSKSMSKADYNSMHNQPDGIDFSNLKPLKQVGNFDE